ncbi:helix-turn-helix domain-containing protein [Streptomyces sp. BI20]|uniref:helix-turn-helix domain-containing protein n=1 Tax=Streptomyces sp. BI20 TaxID=3403460 RepID=UPI003C736206
MSPAPAHPPERPARAAGPPAPGEAAAQESPDVELGRVLTAVGPRLRALRKRRGATLAQLAESTGISVSTLSRLESGRRKPTLELLLPLSRAHRVPLDELVGAPDTRDPRIRPTSFVRNGTTYLPLTRTPMGGVQAFKHVSPPTPYPACGPVPELRVHEGYEWLYVLSGRLRLLLGAHDLELGAGEAAEFDTRTPHAFWNPGPGPAEFLSLFGPQGERVHVRARPTTTDAGAEAGARKDLP